MTTKRLPPPAPHNNEAEETVLGALMLEDDLIWRIRPLLNEADFFAVEHGLIYRAICALADRSSPTSQYAVAGELKRTGQLDEVGGIVYLMGLTTELPTVVGADYFARLIATAAARRRLLTAAQRIAQLAYDEGNDLDLMEIVSRAEEMIRTAMPATLTLGTEALADVTRELQAEWLDEIEGVTLAEGQTTGYRQVDYQMPGAGWMPGKLYGLVGPTSSLKSTIARALAWRTAQQQARRHEGNARVLMISLEQTRKEQWKTRIAASAGLDVLARQREIANAQRAGRTPPPLSADETERVALALEVAAANTDYFLKVQPGLTATEIKVIIQQQMLKGPLDLVVVDYLQRIGPEPHLQKSDERIQIATATRILADTAFLLDVPILLCAQYLIENPGKELAARQYRPDLEKVYGSKELAKVAYLCFGIYWRQYYVKKGWLEPGEDPLADSLVELVVTKAQLGEFGTSAWLIPDPPTGRIEDLACLSCGVLLTGASHFWQQPDTIDVLCQTCTNRGAQ